MKIFKSSILIILLLIASTFLVISCSNDIPKSDLVVKNNLLYKSDSNLPFTGHEKAKVENNIIEYDVKDGYKHGMFKLYDLDGNLQMHGQLDSNRNVGKWEYFYQDGTLESEGNFYYDHPDGKWRWYYSDGKIKEEGYFKNGARTGIWSQFTTDGKIFNQKNYDLKDSSDTEQNNSEDE